jgi:hypothetical protein
MFWNVWQVESEAFGFAVSVCDPFVAYMSGGAFKPGESTESVYLTAVPLEKDPVDSPSRLKVLGWRLAEPDAFRLNLHLFQRIKGG